MTTASLKNEISKALKDISGKSFPEALYTIIHSKVEQDEFELNPGDKNVLDARKRTYNAGKSKTYSLSRVRKKVGKGLSASL